MTETVSSIREAGIKFWMLTGDSMETAINVGFSCKLLDQGTQIFRIDQASKQDIMKYLTMVLKNIQRHERQREQASQNHSPYPEYAAVVTGGGFLKIQQSLRLLDCFMELALTSRALIACRFSPSQKAQLAELLKQYQPRRTTLAVGDGVNDINMMREADIAVSLTANASLISSEGGNHALRSADYSIGQFKHMKPLLLVHGRESYRKNSHVVIFSIYKNLLLMLPIVLFSAYCGFSGLQVYDDWLFHLYSVLFTSVPIVVYGVMDMQFEKEAFLHHPVLYEDGIEAQLLGGRTFVQWLLYAAF